MPPPTNRRIKNRTTTLCVRKQHICFRTTHKGTARRGHHTHKRNGVVAASLLTTSAHCTLPDNSIKVCLEQLPCFTTFSYWQHTLWWLSVRRGTETENHWDFRNSYIRSGTEWVSQARSLQWLSTGTKLLHINPSKARLREKTNLREKWTQLGQSLDMHPSLRAHFKGVFIQ